MNLDLIKISGIFLVTICCVVAAYTDVKRQIIPNKLNISLFFIGISLVTFYFCKSHFFNYFYYISIILVYAFSYLLWYFGVWAGGDVKLLTAISTLFIPEFLDVVPSYDCFNMSLPFNLASFKIPTFLLIFNSVLAVVPVIVIMVLVKIMKDKPYLINDFKKTFDFKAAFVSLNSLILSYAIIGKMNVHHFVLKITFLLIISYLILRIMKRDVVLVTFSLITVVYQVLSDSMLFYISELVILLILLGIKNIFQNGIVREALTKTVYKDDLKEGMILAYPLYRENNRYFFKKTGFLENIIALFSDKDGKNLVCGVKSSGLSKLDIDLIKNNVNQDYYQIKEALSFAPFILSGLLITIALGNTYGLMLLLAGMV